MSPGAVVALIFLVIFIIGVAAGAIAVVALSALRADRRRAALRDMRSPDELSDQDDDDITGPSGVPGHWDDATSGDRPRWPRRDGDHGGRFSRGS
jgi:hypothetical protein